MIPARPSQHCPGSIPFKIVAVYAIVSSLWILFSDSLLKSMVKDPYLAALISIIKGWLFVLVTATILFFLIKRYISMLKETNEDLRESERRFRQLMEQTHMIALMLDTGGNIIFCNDYLLHLTGWTRDEIIGKSWIDTFLSADIKNEITAIFRHGITKGEIPFHYENRILTKSGAELLIVWDNTPLLGKAGNVIGIASLGMDITAHRSTEAQLRQSQKMESIGTLAGGVAHDFNNILTVILSSSEMLRSKIDDRERVKLLIDQIDSAARRAAKLTSSLLAFSRKQLSTLQPVDLNELVTQIHGFLERIIGEDIELRMDLCKVELPVLADRGQIEQVIMNLAGNARDAMPDGGLLTISTDMTEVGGHIFPDDGTSISGEFAVLTISDTGSGINIDAQERIFEPFFTTKEVGKGTGLGLSMAYGIIRQHSGWISLVSEVGRGSCFKVHLPLSSQHKAVADDPVPTPRKGVETILLVEDDELVLQANMDMLENSGYNVIATRSGEEALELFRKYLTAIDLAVIDIIMPKMNGRQVYDALIDINPNLNVLFTSGYTADLLKRKDIPENCPFIAKPFTPQEFIQTVRTLLDRKSDIIDET